MYKTITGFCTFANEEKSIDINYIDVSTLSNQYYAKNRFVRCSDCNAESCPLFTEAPSKIS